LFDRYKSGRNGRMQRNRGINRLTTKKNPRTKDQNPFAESKKAVEQSCKLGRASERLDGKKPERIVNES